MPDTLLPEKPKRTRRAHTKARTGCLTCKIRRKKCDEEKPFCRRCTSTGRKCDGYLTQSSPHTSTSNDAPSTTPEPELKRPRTHTGANSLSPVLAEMRQGPVYDHDSVDIVRPPSNVMFETDNDFYCFDFFRSRTGPEFAAYFDSSIWRTYLIRACYQHPTVLAATVAVGAVHRRFELGISREAFEYCDLSNQMYQRALRRLSDDIASGHPNVAEINMITAKLFSVFETFQGNHELAQMHLAAGLKALLGRDMRTTRRETQYRSVDISYETLRQLFLKLELESVRLFDGPATILSDPEAATLLCSLESDPSFPDATPCLPDPNPYPIPRAFSSLSRARDVLFTEAKWIWHTWGLLEQGALSGTGFSRHQTHTSRLLQWSIAYAEKMKVGICRFQPRLRQAAQLLKVYREAAYLLLLTQMAFHSPDTGAAIVTLCEFPELCDCHRSCRTYAERKEALNAHFARLLVLSESVLNRASFSAYEEHALSMDSGIGPPLYRGDKQRCRSTKVRHQVTSLLGKSEIQARVWDTLGVYAIAEQLASVEEHAIVQSGIVPEELEPKWVDITFFLEERRVLLRYCTRDPEGHGGGLRGTKLVMDKFGGGSGTGGLIWTQEWASF
ncbi:hypothetical protein A1O1_01405 [Capronia coronata CBS 617.96]|uniref:Zn(2)-C6 fungal-type domain-containing protein n=1 Tax=Capronia coronata CBS 617.96 TaxID=1182541 RepID=W9ZP57_9EURO|nr:uncharacterized protein A1O1_01405 [Capronia coronata CBS 617.96]EXJ96279.1 hypothetical protein A1O1_01405 [Capronia coronata CBS 617.96]